MFDCCGSGQIQLCVQQIARTSDEARHLHINNCVRPAAKDSRPPDAGPGGYEVAENFAPGAGREKKNSAPHDQGRASGVPAQASHRSAGSQLGRGALLRESLPVLPQGEAASPCTADGVPMSTRLLWSAPGIRQASRSCDPACDPSKPEASATLPQEPEWVSVAVDADDNPAFVPDACQLADDLPSVEWGTGLVRVLLVASSSSASGSVRSEAPATAGPAVGCGIGGGTPARSGLDGALRVEQWCRSCGIKDVTLLALPASQDAAASRRQLQDAAQAISERCQPGDTCVLHLALAGLDATLCGDDVAEPQAGAAFPARFAAAEGEGEASLLRRLPERTTVVCLGDSPSVASLLGLGEAALSGLADRPLKVVLFLISPGVSACDVNSPVDDGAAADAAATPCADDPSVESAASASPASTVSPCPAASRSAGICATALLRAADALSLADGPCSLSCRDVLAEVGEQVADLATAAGLPAPHVLLRGHPAEATAGDVLWPIAAAPRNKAIGTSKASDASTPVRATASSPASTPSPSLKARPLAGSPFAGGGTPDRASRIRSCTPPEIERLSPCARSGAPRNGSSHGRRRAGSAGGHQRAMPTSLGGLAKVLTGGAVSSDGVMLAPDCGASQRRRGGSTRGRRACTGTSERDPASNAAAHAPSASFAQG
mmetsp:Transcript_157/g.333  ORF Transcript_157/g.333 Transcript_157/m.333 type:complete len:664 (-) Transcript_157:109-2100(-)